MSNIIWNILIIADELGEHLKEEFEKEKDFVITVVPSYNQYDLIFNELNKKVYHLIMLTNNALSPKHICEVVPILKNRYPKTRIMVLSGWTEDEFMEELRNYGIEDVVSAPLPIAELERKIRMILNR